MTDKLDIVGIGNAMVDAIIPSNKEEVEKNNLNRDSMNLIDEERSKFLFDNINSPKVISGGSAANTAVGLASLGSTAAFIGKVKNDELGNTFKRDIEEVGVSFDTPLNENGPRTASSTILITPDAERSMNTFLGACVNLDAQDIDENLIKKSKLVYLEGYLFDPPQAKEAFRKAAKVAKDENNLVAITLSDSFCVERHRDDFIIFIKNFADILFCNEDEIKSLYECDLESAKHKVEEMGKETVITLGSNGSTVFIGLYCEPPDLLVALGSVSVIIFISSSRASSSCLATRSSSISPPFSFMQSARVLNPERTASFCAEISF